MNKILALGAFLLLIGMVNAQMATPGLGEVTTTTLPAQAVTLPTPSITPDSWFYGIKRFWQSVDMGLTFDPASKAQKEVNYANERLAEVRYEIGKGDFNKAMQIKAEYDTSLNTAENNLAQAEAAGTDTTSARSTIQQQLTRHEQVIQTLINNVNNTVAKDALQKALDNQEKHRQEQINQEMKNETRDIRQNDSLNKTEKHDAIKDVKNETRDEIHLIQNQTNPDFPRVCTMEAKKCPNGGYVQRNAQMGCDFNPCPGEKIEQKDNQTGHNTPSIGGQRDEHGCLGPAGFAWNATISKCVRPWSGETQLN
jgi:hypothetical protein